MTVCWSRSPPTPRPPKRPSPGWTGRCASFASGDATNIEFVINLLKHPTFLDNTYTTKFIDTTPELFHFKRRRDRATKILTYIADITVNGHPETAGRPKPPADARAPKPPALIGEPPMGTRNLLEQKGPQAVADWMRAQ